MRVRPRPRTRIKRRRVMGMTMSRRLHGDISFTVTIL